MDADVASARVIEGGEGSSDYYYCAMKSHIAALIASGCVPGASGVALYDFLLLISCATRSGTK